MSTVNDLMVFLNKTFGLRLPVVPLERFAQVVSGLWQATVKNWTGGSPVTEVVEIDLPANFTMPIAGADLTISEASILVRTPPPGPSNDP